MKRLTLLFFLVLPAFAALSVPITVQETLFPGDQTGHTNTLGSGGIARTDEPFCKGVPIADAAAITSTSVLGLTGATAGQFRILGKWPSLNAKWIEVCGIVASVAAGSTTTVTLTDTGAGNFGGLDLASGSGTITVATGAATFTILSANFNLVDTAVVGGTTVIATGTGPGLVVVGPSTTGVFPDNVTCGSGAGQSPCTRIYSSANDASATSVIEVNGPVKCVIRTDFTYKDIAGNSYFKATVRQTFYRNKTYDSVRLIDRNADYSATTNFASAFKGMAAHEMRLTPSYANANPVTYQIAADPSVNSGACTSAVCTGTLTQGGSDFAYIYQGQSIYMHGTSSVHTEYTGMTGYPSVLSQTPDLGYKIFKNATQQASGISGTTSPLVAGAYPTGWADVADSTGRGIEIGVRFMAAFFNKSLEFTNGGANVAIGLWPSENGNPTGGPGNGTVFHYQPWQERAVFDFFLNFHTTALTGTTAANAFLSWQHPLVGRESWQYANTTNAYGGNNPFPMTDPAVEDAFYTSLGAKLKPSRSWSYSNQDWGVTFNNNFYAVMANRTEAWGQGGPGGQKDIEWGHLLNFIRRGHTGELVDAINMNQLIVEKYAPWLDNGDFWKNHANNAELDNFDKPRLVPQNYAAVYNNGAGIYDFGDYEHRHRAGIIDLYYLTGDETYKDWINNTLRDYYTNNAPITNGNPTGWLGTAAMKGGYVNDRSIAGHLENAARLSTFFTDQGDAADAALVTSVADTVYSLQLHPDLCVSGFPAGCVFTGASVNAAGVSRVRGMAYGTYKNVTGAEGDATCGTSTFRVNTPFKQGMLQSSMWEYRKFRGAGWQYYTEIFDLMYGNSQWALTEGYADTGTGSDADNGFRYYQSLDSPNNVPAGCAAMGHAYDYFQPTSRDDVWFNFSTQYLYNGSVTSWKEKFINAVQKNYADIADVGMYPSGQVIDAVMNPPTSSLVTAQIASVTGPSGGNYSVTVVVPPGATSYRAKCSTTAALTLVEWIGFDSATNTWAQPNRTPATYQNWFAGTEITGLPAPNATSPRSPRHRY